jgi:hypothetical protein
MSRLRGYTQLSESEYGARVISASGQPGYNNYLAKRTDIETLARLKEGSPITIVDRDLMNNLQELHDEGARIVYSLASAGKDRHPELLKYLWEEYFNKDKDGNPTPTSYVTEIDGVSIAIHDFSPPSQEQLIKITDDIIKKSDEGHHVHVHCGYGCGRTGTILTALNMKLFKENMSMAKERMIRNYPYGDVETSDQMDALETFGGSLGVQYDFSSLTQGHSHDNPYSFHGAPYSLHSDPYSLHSDPYSLHGDPYSLHSDPYKSPSELDSKESFSSEEADAFLSSAYAISHVENPYATVSTFPHTESFTPPSVEHLDVSDGTAPKSDFLTEAKSIGEALLEEGVAEKTTKDLTNITPVVSGTKKEGPSV